MTKQIRVIKSEWHQVEKRYGMLLTRYELDDIYPESSEEENDELWEQILNDDIDFHELQYDAELQEVYLDWDWLDEDDWWTDRKGGYEVTYSIEKDYEEPLQDWKIIENLKLEVNALLAEKNQPKKYPEVRTDEELSQALQELKDEFDKLVEEDEEWVEVGSEAWTEEMDAAAKAEDTNPKK